MTAAMAPRRASKQAAEEEDEQSGNDGDVETGNGNDMGCAGVFVGLLQGGGQAVIVSEQDACQERGFRFREDAVNVVDGMFFEGSKPAAGTGLPAREGQERGSGIRHVGQDTLAGQVVLVGEILVFRGCL